MIFFNQIKMFLTFLHWNNPKTIVLGWTTVHLFWINNTNNLSEASMIQSQVDLSHRPRLSLCVCEYVCFFFWGSGSRPVIWAILSFVHGADSWPFSKIMRHQGSNPSLLHAKYIVWSLSLSHSLLLSLFLSLHFSLSPCFSLSLDTFLRTELF